MPTTTLALSRGLAGNATVSDEQSRACGSCPPLPPNADDVYRTRSVHARRTPRSIRQGWQPVGTEPVTNRETRVHVILVIPKQL